MSFLLFVSLLPSFLFFFFNDTATTEIYTLSLHDALPILLNFTAGSAGCAPPSAVRSRTGVALILGSAARVSARSRGTSTRDASEVDTATVASSAANVVHCPQPPKASAAGTETTNAILLNALNMATPSFGFCEGRCPPVTCRLGMLPRSRCDGHHTTALVTA